LLNRRDQIRKLWTIDRVHPGLCFEPISIRSTFKPSGTGSDQAIQKNRCPEKSTSNLEDWEEQQKPVNVPVRRNRVGPQWGDHLTQQRHNRGYNNGIDNGEPVERADRLVMFVGGLCHRANDFDQVSLRSPQTICPLRPQHDQRQRIGQDTDSHSGITVGRGSQNRLDNRGCLNNIGGWRT
jgi:hypothetical protein